MMHGWEGHMFSWWSISLMGALIIIAVFAIVMRSRSAQAAPHNDAPLNSIERRSADGERDRGEVEQQTPDFGG